GWATASWSTSGNPPGRSDQPWTSSTSSRRPVSPRPTSAAPPARGGARAAATSAGTSTSPPGSPPRRSAVRSWSATACPRQRRSRASPSPKSGRSSSRGSPAPSGSWRPADRSQPAAERLGQATEPDRAELERRGVPALEVEAGPPSRLLTGGKPGPLAELVGDGLGRPAEVADHLGVDLMRFGAAAPAGELAGGLEGPPGAVRQRQVEVEADVDDHAGGAQRGVGEHAEPGPRDVEPPQLVGKPLGVQCPALAVPGDPGELREARQALPRHPGGADLQVVAWHPLVEDDGQLLPGREPLPAADGPPGPARARQVLTRRRVVGGPGGGVGAGRHPDHPSGRGDVEVGAVQLLDRLVVTVLEPSTVGVV